MKKEEIAEKKIIIVMIINAEKNRRKCMYLYKNGVGTMYNIDYC